MGNVQGGFLAAMLDDTLGPALAATLGDGEFAPTLELKVSFLRPAAPGRITGTGRVVHRGGSIAFLAGELRDETGDVLATATATVRIIRAQRLTPRRATRSSLMPTDVRTCSCPATSVAARADRPVRHRTEKSASRADAETERRVSARLSRLPRAAGRTAVPVATQVELAGPYFYTSPCLT
jgi:uncharacterized protein (TIGR00369 family)